MGTAAAQSEIIWDSVAALSLPLRSRAFDLTEAAMVHVDAIARRGIKSTVVLEIHDGDGWSVWRTWQTSRHDPRAAWFSRMPPHAVAGRLTTRGPFESVSARVEVSA